MHARTLFASLLLIISIRSFSQTITASIEGLVKDQTGAVIVGAQVLITNTDTNVAKAISTDTTGHYVAPSLPPGRYSILVEAAGFKKVERAGIDLQVNQAARLDLTMELGATSETVEVVGRAPLLNTSSAAVGQVVENRSIIDLPLNERNPWALVFLTPGTVGSTGSSYNNVNISINGGRPGSAAMMVDGIPSSTPLAQPIQGFTIIPSAEGVQEFNVQSSNYSAEFGRSGGGIINLVYKSGTNQLHGSAFEFLRNSKLDANNFFSNRTGTPLASFKRHQFGGSLGGPVILPRLYDGRNRTFFFVDYEGLRQSTATTLSTTMPTVLQRSGNFSQTRNAAGAQVVIYDPLNITPSGTGFTRQPFADNIIPATRLDPVGKNVAAFYPLPNQPGAPNTGANNFFLSGGRPTQTNQGDIKVDENVNDRNRFFVRVSRRIFDNGLPEYNYPADIAAAQTGTSGSQAFFNTALDYTHNLSPTFLIDARYGFGRTLVTTLPRSLGFDPIRLGLPDYMRQIPALMFPGFNPTGYATLGNGGGGQLVVMALQTHSASINNMKVFTRHLLKFGFDWRLMQANNISGGSPAGAFQFTKSFTQGPNPNATTAIAGDAMASLLLGLGTGSLILNGKDSATQSPYYCWYVADDWRVTNRLTLNIGMRYGLDLPLTERYNRMNVFDPNVASPLAGPAGLPDLKGGLVFMGTGGMGRRPVATDLSGWEPRFGFAYQAAKNTVLRGGYGIFHPPFTFAANSTIGQTGYSSTTQFISADDNVTPQNYLRNPFPGGLVPVPGNVEGLLTGRGTSITAGLAGDNTMSYVQNWNFNVQEQLPGNILIEAGYVGNRSLHLAESNFWDYNLNQLTPAQLALGSSVLQERWANPFLGQIRTGTLSTPTVPYSSLAARFPQFTSVFLTYNSGASSVYHSFQLRAEKRFQAGLSFLAAYTAGKLIDDYSVNADSVGTGAGIQNIYDRRADRSVSPGDISQSLVLSYVVQLPFGKGKRFGNGWNGIVDSFLGGWQFNGISTFQTGQPLVLTTNNTSQSGSNVLRPNNNGKSAALSGPAGSRLDRYFDTSVFSQPAPLTFGNTGRALPDVRKPGISNFDFSLFKSFHIMERTSLQFRAEAFNLMNTPQFGAPVTNQSGVQFGIISSQANSPRQLQFGLKLLF